MKGKRVAAHVFLDLNWDGGESNKGRFSLHNIKMYIKLAKQ